MKYTRLAAILLLTASFSIPVKAATCTAEGSTVQAAQQAFKSRCGDIDVSNYVLTGTKDTVDTPPVSMNNGHCSVFGKNIRAARRNYAAQCSRPRKDCDPRDGGFYCASYDNPRGATEDRLDPVTPPEPEPEPPVEIGYKTFSSKQPWSDSYSVNGQCYCDSNFDHGLKNISMDTPNGRKKVSQVCADIKRKIGTGPRNGRSYFNTIQCGNGPANTAIDEKTCPGIPRGRGDYKGNGCNVSGPTFNLSSIYASNTAVTIEAEDFLTKSSEWSVGTGRAGTSGTYVEIASDTRVTHTDPLIHGENFWRVGGEGPTLTYHVDVAAGRYLVSARAYSTGTEDNSLFVGANGDWLHDPLQWCQGKRSWASSSAVRKGNNHCGTQGTAIINLREGRNVLQLSAREDGVEVDSFTLTKVGNSVSPPVTGDNTDLFLLNYDGRPDADDMLALVAGKAVSDAMKITPLVSYFAYGTQPHKLVKGFEAHAKSLYPHALDARKASSVRTAAARVLSTLKRGKRVYMVDGGQSDYSADIIREVKKSYTGSLKGRVYVVQHSVWNERYTTASDLRYVKAQATYQKIQDGNHVNRTADLNKGRKDADCRQLLNKVKSGKYAAQWKLASDAQLDDRECDFSDTVSYLHALGENIKDMNSFTNRYL